MAKIMQLANIFLVGFFFGTNANTDLHYYLYTFVIVIIPGFTAGIDSSVIMPEFIRLKNQISERVAIGFLNKYLLYYLLIFAVFSVVGIFNAVGFYNLFSNTNISVLIANKLMLILSFLTLILVVFSNLLANVINAYGKFSIPNVLLLINSVFALTILIFFKSNYGIISVFMGITIGYAVNLLLLLSFLLLKLNWSFFTITKSHNKELVKFTFINQTGALIVVLRSLCVQYFLSGLSAGVLTAVSWGTQIASLTDSFLNVQFYKITGVKFSEYSALKKINKPINLFNAGFGLLILLNAIVFLLLFTTSESIVAVISQFTKMNSITKSALVITMVYLSLTPLINVFTFLALNVLASYKLLNQKFLNYSILGQIVLLVLSWIFMKFFDYIGYILASNIGFLFLAFLHYKIIKDKFKEINILALWQIVASNVYMLVISLIFAYTVKFYFREFLVQYPILSIILTCIVATIIYYKTIFKKLKDFNSIVYGD
jgi:peptidoglycan biosynthesis protein MviN/MurJ (putative lipid II flippase)